MTGTSQMQKTCVVINALSAHEVVVSAGCFTISSPSRVKPHTNEKIKILYFHEYVNTYFKGCIKNKSSRKSFKNIKNNNLIAFYKKLN